jgi:hypothetical protein
MRMRRVPGDSADGVTLLVGVLVGVGFLGIDMYEGV